MINRKGFTVIELVAVIMILFVFMYGALVIIVSHIQKARDTTRINNIIMLNDAVNKYYLENGVYPGKHLNDTKRLQSSEVLGKYIKSPIVDPKNNKKICRSDLEKRARVMCGYMYAGGYNASGISGGGYELSVAFEHNNNYEDLASDSKDKGNDDTRYELSNGMQHIYNTATFSTTRVLPKYPVIYSENIEL